MVVVAAVDRSNGASDVVSEAERLATEFDESIHVVHALTRSEFVTLGTANAQADQPLNLDQIREEAAKMAAEAVLEIDERHETVGLVGDPADEIIDYANEVTARYVVVRPRRKSPAGKALFGSVAQSILLDANCPVVTVS
ncbi:universal stress protein [Halostagnicola sp. A-GB9-2]|uniref:universal stress protein n=1 Tax=Halostagnicola sp. A-GB9-2 TaxID=3048066 RepID=UPI0024BF6966|nr:universal stress protein [Halostagnicola sp. A-GB9-2]MDJ1433684.1 universal stress protein [Halostagnicola sp. A-GB9-2]